MDIKTKEDGGVVILALAGEVDISVTDLAREVIRKLLEDKKKAIVVEMSQVPYIDSSGLGMLVEAKQELEKYGGEIKLCGLTSDVKKVFELTRLNKFFHIFESEQEAQESFSHK